MTIGERIKKRRIDLQMSQDELAKKVGYKSRSSINKIELARELPLKKVEAMARALECTPSYLMGWTEETQETISRIRNALDPNVPKKEEISENDRHTLFCYHLLDNGAKTSVDLILNNAYQEYLKKRDDWEGSTLSKEA